MIPHRVEEIDKNLVNIFSRSHKLWNIELIVDGERASLQDLEKLAELNHWQDNFVPNSIILSKLIGLLKSRAIESIYLERERLQEFNRIKDLLSYILESTGNKKSEKVETKIKDDAEQVEELPKFKEVEEQPLEKSAEEEPEEIEEDGTP